MDLPPNSIPQFQLDTLSVSGGIEATIETLMASRNDRQVYTILSKQIPDVIVVLLASEFLLRHRVAIEAYLRYLGSEELRSEILSRMLSRFPSVASGFLASPQLRIIEVLTTAIGGIAPPDDIDGTALEELFRKVRCATQALEATSLMQFDEHTSVVPELTNTKKQKVSRNQLKRDLSEAAKKKTLDDEIFKVFQVGLPTSREEWDNRVEKFLTSQRDSLEVW